MIFFKFKMKIGKKDACLLPHLVQRDRALVESSLSVEGQLLASLLHPLSLVYARSGEASSKIKYHKKQILGSGRIQRT